MSTVLGNALETIEKERSSNRFHDAFTAVDEVLKEWGENQLADRLVGAIPSTVSWEVVADLLGILTWSTSDNGAAIMRTAERWLREGDDNRKLQIALNLDAYPFRDRTEMEQVLGHLSEVNSVVAARCQVFIATRRELKE